MGKVFRRGAAGLALLALGLAGWLVLFPPDMVRVATNYAAKITCSNVFAAHRPAEDVIRDDLRAPGHWIFKGIKVSVGEREVIARLLGLLGAGRAEYRGERLGCTSTPAGAMAASSAKWGGTVAPAAPLPAGALWPEGEKVEPSQNPEIAALLDDPAMQGPEMRGLVVVHNGRIVGERYGAGFGKDTPLLGWSMTKTVTTALIGLAVRDGKITLGRTGLRPEWTDKERAAISVSALTSMSSGLAWNEGYGDVSDVTRMLYLEGDMAGYATSKPHDPLHGNPEDDRLFNYSSGTTDILSEVWMRAVGEDRAYGYLGNALFGPIGMTSAVLETDAAGIFVGSSYMYATARDWARFGLLLAQRGAWNGRALLPAGFVDWMASPAPASMTVYGRPEYGMGSVWLAGPDAGTPKGTDPDAGFDLPADTYWALGHDGQSIAVVPSKGLVVVRLGLTPSKLGFKPQKLVAALVKAVGD